jgi:hypothetical protein
MNPSDYNPRYPSPTYDDPGFQDWYAEMAKRKGINSDPDATRHNYRYDQAYNDLMNKQGHAAVDDNYQWPDQYMTPSHPLQNPYEFQSQSDQQYDRTMDYVHDRLPENIRAPFINGIEQSMQKRYKNFKGEQLLNLMRRSGIIRSQSRMGSAPPQPLRDMQQYYPEPEQKLYNPQRGMQYYEPTLPGQKRFTQPR